MKDHPVSDRALRQRPSGWNLHLYGVPSSVPKVLTKHKTGHATLTVVVPNVSPGNHLPRR